MGLFRSGEVVGIAEAALEFARAAAADSHPDEYMGLLRGDSARKLGLDRDGTVLSDVLVIPGTQSNPVSATVKTNMVPNDVRAAGSIHSHPNGVLKPSTTDLNEFGRGDVHVILGAPYEQNDWAAYDSEGTRIDLPVVDVDPPEEVFFDFDQADIDAELREEGRTGERDGRTADEGVGRDGEERVGWDADERDGWGSDEADGRDDS